MHIIAQHDQLASVSTQFQQQSGVVSENLSKLINVIEDLRNGGWEGEGSDAFFNSVTSYLYPSLQRLMAALNTASDTTREISGGLHEIEDANAQRFNKK